MGIAIITRFKGPTNTAGSRYSASAGGRMDGRTDRLTRASDHALSPLRNRATVARALAEKLEWGGLWIVGGLDGSDTVYVHLSASAEVSAAAAALLDKAGEGEDWFYIPE